MPDSKMSEEEQLEQFWLKQSELVEQWNSSWGKNEAEEEASMEAEADAQIAAMRKEEEEAETALKQSVFYCEGGLGPGCERAACVRIHSNTKSLYYVMHLCASCWKKDPLYKASQCPEGVSVQKIDVPADFQDEESKEEIKIPAAAPKSSSSSSSASSSSSSSSTRKNPPVDMKAPTAFLFNGQGAQTVGMTKEVADLPAVKAMYATANKVLGYDLQALCVKGPKEKLDKTQHAQPAMLVAGLAALEKLRHENPAAINSATATAGLSLGEYTALVFAGAISFEDAIALVKVRGEAMARASKKTKGGMVSIVGLSDEEVIKLCSEVSTQDKTVKLANYLMPTGRVVSGHEELLGIIEAKAKAAGAKKATRLFVSGAFHTELMQPAQKTLMAALKSVTINFPPRVPVYSNVTAKPFASADEIRSGLAKQLCQPVKWEPTIRQLLEDGVTQLYELAPRNQLKAMARLINRDVHKRMINVQV